MPQYPHHKVLSLLSVLLIAACGGGGGGEEAGASGTGTNSMQAGSASTTTTGVATTTSSTATTTSSTATTTVNGQTTTTAATATTTSSTTTTTGNTTPLPPLSGTPIVLTKDQLGTSWTRDGNTGSGGANQEGARAGNAECLSYGTMQNATGYFVSAHLSIFKDGQRLALPADIGIMANCLYEINTDNRSGVIDAWSTKYKRLTLGDFFKVWGQPLAWDNVAGFTGQPIVIYVDDGSGYLRRHMGDPGDIELNWHFSITIQIGSALAEIPTYDWRSYTSH